MRKGIVLLIVALLYGSVAFARPDSKVPVTDTSRPTVTLTQEQFDSLIAASAKVNQMEYVSKTDCDRMFSDYINHVGWVVGLFGVLCTILVAIVGVAVPILLNRKFENDIKERIDRHDEQLNKTKEEIDNAKKSAEQNAMDAKVSALFSQAYYETDLDKQIDLYKIVLNLDSKNVEAYNNLGNVYGKKGDCDRAIGFYNKTIELNPQYEIAYSNRGYAYYILGNNARAIEDCNKAVELNPQNAITYNIRGLAYMDRGNDGDYKLAMNDFKTGLSLSPDETTRKMLENNMEKLKAKMQGPKKDE